MKTNSRMDNHMIKKRQVRIFLSSTFSDMQEERTCLINTFQILRLEANRRNVDLCVVDLRWGVTEEESRDGKTISVCLGEIERSYPFFIGLLGNHYGSSIDSFVLEKNPELNERYPWLKADISAGLSFTEIEILYGVLRNNRETDALFYIKQTTDPDDNPKLSDLKRRVRQQQRCSVSDYTNIEELCVKVETHVMGLLDRYFPITEISNLDKERSAQQSYINNQHSHYIKRQSYFDLIDAFVKSKEQQLVFSGESGIGKSALLANWIKENECRDDFYLVYHFIGNSFSDNNYESILHHLCEEIYNLYSLERQHNLDGGIEGEAQHLLNSIATQEKPLVIIIDGINQIFINSNEKLLLWLPATNEKVKYVFSTLEDDETMRVFKQRGYRIETVAPLNTEERCRFVVDYLDSVGKHLGDNMLQRIVDDKESENTLVLKSLLDELICFGSYKQLDSRINYYLSASSIPEFFDRVLARMEEDYSANQGLVRHALFLISVSERGLSGEEIMDILGCQERDWNLFFCSFYNHFIVKEGIISFSHQYVTYAVEKRYIIAKSPQIDTFRNEIISLFDSINRKGKSPNTRCISELAHQYYHLADWKGLYKTLLSFDAFDYYYSNQPLLGLYWRSLLNNGKKYSMIAYLKVGKKKNELSVSSFFSDIATFIFDYIPDYKYNISLKYFSVALEMQKRNRGNNSSKIADLYNNIGLVYDAKDDFQSARYYYQKALRIYRRSILDNKENIATVYSNLGLLYNTQGEYRNALNCYNKALLIDMEISGNKSPATATLYNNIGSVLGDKGNYSKALGYYQKALEIYTSTLGIKHPDTAVALNNIAIIYRQKGNYATSLDYHKKALVIDEEVLGINHSQTAKDYYNIGQVYYEKGDRGDYDKAIEYFEKAIKIDKNNWGVNHHDTAVDYLGIGYVYDKLGDHRKALEYFKKTQKIFEKVFGKDNLVTATLYNDMGTAYFGLAKYSKAMDYYQRSLVIRKKLLEPCHPDLATLYNDIGAVYYKQRDYVESLKYYRKSLKIDERVHGINHPDTARDYNNIGLVYGEREDYYKALKYLYKALSIRIDVLGNNHIDTAISYNNIGTILLDTKNYSVALEYFKKSLRALKIHLTNNDPYICDVQQSIDDASTAMKVNKRPRKQVHVPRQQLEEDGRSGTSHNL